MKKLIEVIILAIVQGVTEPLPISSSGHLVIFQKLFNIEVGKGLDLELLLHLGSLVAIVVFYWKDIKDLFGKGFGYLWEAVKYLFSKGTLPSKEKQPFFLYGLNVVIATIPAAIIGVLFKDKIADFFTNTKTVGFALIFTAIVLYTAFRIRGHKTEEDIKPKNAILTGLMQVIALIPGVSRSGSTTCASLVQGFDVQSSMKFSFMMFIPVALGAILFDVKDFFAQPDLATLAIPYAVGVVVSGVVTYVCLRLFKKVLEKRRLDLFAVYCLTVGVATLIFL